jgi:hypothetical protein
MVFYYVPTRTATLVPIESATTAGFRAIALIALRDQARPRREMDDAHHLLVPVTGQVDVARGVSHSVAYRGWGASTGLRVVG